MIKREMGKMANLRDSAVEEVEQADQLALREVGESISAETKSSMNGSGRNTGFVYTLREVMRVRMAKFAACVLFVTLMAAVFAPWLTS
jgi:hypothetical protein